MKWLLILFLVHGNGPSRAMLIGDSTKSEFNTEVECRDVQQALLKDSDFIGMMFREDGILVPTCIQVSESQLRELKK